MYGTSGALDGVVLEGPMEVLGTVNVYHGLELHGTIWVGATNQGGTLSFYGASQVLGG